METVEQLCERFIDVVEKMQGIIVHRSPYKIGVDFANDIRIYINVNQIEDIVTMPNGDVYHKHTATVFPIEMSDEVRPEYKEIFNSLEFEFGGTKAYSIKSTANKKILEAAMVRAKKMIYKTRVFAVDGIVEGDPLDAWFIDDKFEYFSVRHVSKNMYEIKEIFEAPTNKLRLT